MSAEPEKPCQSLLVAFAEAEAPKSPKRRDKEVAVGNASEIPVGKCKIVQIGHLSIGLFHLEEGFYALRNDCPHQGAELCKGSIHGTHRPSDVTVFDPAYKGRIVRCPWHGWEFDIVSGKGLYNAKDRVPTYEVRVGPDGELTLLV
jgi:nitrite reductase (NADH) small subunit